MTESTGVPATRPSPRANAVSWKNSSGWQRPVRTPASVACRPIGAPAHGLEEGRFLGLAGLAEIGLDGPGLLGVPFEAGALGVIGGLPGQGDGLPEIAPVVPLDDRLGIGIADIDVGVGEEPDLPRHHGLDRELAAADGSVVEGHFDRHGLVPVDGRQKELEGVVAELQLEPGLGGLAARDDRAPRRAEVTDLDPDDLEEPAVLADQGLLAPGPDVAAQIVAEDHEPVVRAGFFARDPDPQRPARMDERGRHLEPHEAEELVELVDHDRLEREGYAVRAGLPPLPARRVGRRPEAQGLPAVDGQVEAMGALARRVAGQPDESQRSALPVGRDGFGLPFDGHGPVRGPADERGGDVGVGGMVGHLGAGEGPPVALEPFRPRGRGGRRHEGQQSARPPHRHEPAPFRSRSRGRLELEDPGMTARGLGHGAGRERQERALAHLLPADGFPDAEHPDRRALGGRERGQHELGRGPGLVLVGEVDGVDRPVRERGEAGLGFLVGSDGPRPVDGLAVDRHPFADGPEPVQGLGREFPLGARPDVEQEVPALGDDVDEQVDEPVRRLVDVLRVIGPRVAHGHAGLPGIGEGLLRDLLFGRAVVLVAPRDRPVDDEEAGLVAAGHGRDPGHVDVHVLGVLDEITRPDLDHRAGADPAAVEPEDVERAVAGDDLLDLAVGEVAEALPALRISLGAVIDVAVGGGPLGGPEIAVVPVGLGEVGPGPEALGPESVEDGPEDVGLGVRPEGHLGSRDAVVGLLGVVHGEAVVVLGGHDDVAHAGGLGRGGPGGGIESPRVEGPRQGLVGLLVLHVVVHGAPAPGLVLGADAPGFDDAPLAVRSPVHHEAELPILPAGEPGQDEGIGLEVGFGGLGGDDDGQGGQGQP